VSEEIDSHSDTPGCESVLQREGELEVLGILGGGKWRTNNSGRASDHVYEAEEEEAKKKIN